ncbi:MAG TPA: imidazole glycerol phosphate synthase subunit HisH [Solirubrobacteraceae bacterium]|nr:imidazole glycerol phosphate synthase subunit HisH [Solirubrobacteraceae bacterium]
MTTIAVVDYGMGNRRSVQKALEHIGAEAPITRDHEQIRGAGGIVVPGVGAFGVAMRNLDELGLADLLRERAGEGVPLLGICLGMQLLFERSEELGQSAGLGLLSGEVTRLDTGGLRIPHIGWNEVSFERPCPLTSGLGDTRSFYHVHSFAVRPGEPQEVVGTTAYGERFATIVARDNVLGVQFHPEKSSASGLALLGNFVNVCARAVSPA